MSRLISILMLLYIAGMQAATALEYREQKIRIQDVTYKATVPAGYQLEFLNGQMDGPRMLSFAPNGDMFVGSKADIVYRLPPPYTRAFSFVELDGYPHGVAFRQGEILVARTNGLYRADYQPGQQKMAADQFQLLARLPGGGGHSSRTVMVGSDSRVYVSLGITGNCSDEYIGDSYVFNDRRGGVLVLDEKKAKLLPFATGLRNPVGFDWHPQTKVMYASNNGPDHRGFEQPPEYFSRLEPGSFHGMPWFQYDGESIQEDDCVASKPPRPLRDVVAPVATFPARNAPMAVAFITPGSMDKQLENSAVVALHGSWATRPSGGFFGRKASRRPPKLVLVKFSNGKAQAVEDLVSGFQLDNGKRWARPIGLAVGPDGALYFTSDGGIHGLFRLRKL